MSPFFIRVARVSAWVGLAVLTGLLVRNGGRRLDTLLGVRVQTDVRIRTGAGVSLYLDVYQSDLPLPRPAKGRPALIAIHGGGWRGGSKTEYGRALVPLVRRGYVVVAVDYRLSRPGVASWPDNLNDIREAVVWVREHAAVLEIDPERIAAIGASAGAHLALLLGSYSKANPSGVSAVLDFYGPTDLRILARKGAPTIEPIRLLLGGTGDESPNRFDEASPVSQVTSASPPTLILHGSDDALVPLEQSRMLARALETLGIPHKLVVVEGARHGFELHAGDRDLVPEIEGFLASVWSLPETRP